MTHKLSLDTLPAANSSQPSDVMIRLSPEESIKLVEAVLDPARGPHPRLIAAARRYLASMQTE